MTIHRRFFELFLTVIAATVLSACGAGTAVTTMVDGGGPPPKDPVVVVEDPKPNQCALSMNYPSWIQPGSPLYVLGLYQQVDERPPRFITIGYLSVPSDCNSLLTSQPGGGWAHWPVRQNDFRAFQTLNLVRASGCADAPGEPDAPVGYSRERGCYFTTALGAMTSCLRSYCARENAKLALDRAPR